MNEALDFDAWEGKMLSDEELEKALRGICPLVLRRSGHWLQIERGNRHVEIEVRSLPLRHLSQHGALKAEEKNHAGKRRLFRRHSGQGRT